MQGLGNELSCTNPGRKRSKRSASVSTDGELSQKLSRTCVPSDTHRLEDIPVLRHQSGEGDAVSVKRIMCARDVNEGIEDDGEAEYGKPGAAWRPCCGEDGPCTFVAGHCLRTAGT